MKRLKKISWIIFIALMIVLALNYQVIFDFIKGTIYAPSLEMTEVRESLDLNSRGEFLFNASMPVLNNEVETILGCYTEQKIYVYDIKDKELDGVVELTAAHELLHAVYDRMSIRERDELREVLERVYNENLEVLKDEVSAYDSAEQLEEMYVRIGTEVKSIPEELESNYAKIFNNRKAIVGFYEKYNGVFKKYEEELKNLETRLKEINAELDGKSGEYSNRVNALNNSIDAFNDCANTIGCFKSDTEFYNKREELLSEKRWVEGLYNEIESLINQYNNNVEKYNENVFKIDRIQDIINSHIKINDIN